MKKLLLRKGFTLIELIIVITLIGILTTLAIPTYKSHVTKTYRVDAEQTLMLLAIEIERFRIKNGAYAYRVKDKELIDFYRTDGTVVTFNREKLLEKYAVKFYDISIQNTDLEFQLTATPKEGQQSDGQLFTNQCGLQGWDKDNNAPPSTFWYHDCDAPDEYYEIPFP